MKILDDFMTKIGVDKVLHFFCGGFICAVITFMTLLQDGLFTNAAVFGSVLIGTICVIVLSVIKEIADGKFEWKDILAGIIGCFFIWLAIGLGLLFNYSTL